MLRKSGKIWKALWNNLWQKTHHSDTAYVAELLSQQQQYAFLHINVVAVVQHQIFYMCNKD
jgi:hypothetical protein